MTKTEKFIYKSKLVHNDIYLYNKTNYINSKEKVIITCKEHGEFLQSTTKHLLGRGCPECGGSKKMTWSNFLIKADERHNNKFLYKEQKFENGRSKITITCKEHGDFTQMIEAHLRGQGCPDCGGSKKYTKETLLKNLLLIHGSKYKYNLDNFKNNTSIINIQCKEHGEFKMKVSNHLQGQNCNLCYRKSLSYSNEVYIGKCNKIHCNMYNYEKTNFIKNNTIVTITCPKHGDFEQNSRSHLRGNGCQKCKLSNGEIKIEHLLKTKNIKYKTQVIFDGCVYKRNLPFDFYLYENNVCIEYDGKQHYTPIEYFGGKEMFNIQQIRDNIKNNYCIKNNIKLFRIRYDEKDIEEKLNSILNEI